MRAAPTSCWKGVFAAAAFLFAGPALAEDPKILSGPPIFAGNAPVLVAELRQGVVADLREPPVAVPVHPAVADVCDRQDVAALAAGKGQGAQRRAHAKEVDVAGGPSEHRLVGPVDRSGETGPGPVVERAQHASHRLRRGASAARVVGLLQALHAQLGGRQ